MIPRLITYPRGPTDSVARKCGAEPGAVSGGAFSCRPRHRVPVFPNKIGVATKREEERKNLFSVPAPPLPACHWIRVRSWLSDLCCLCLRATRTMGKEEKKNQKTFSAVPSFALTGFSIHS